MSIAWKSAGGSDVGKLRKGNEDTLRIDETRGVFLVADGMGGHAAGEVASDLAATAVEEALTAAVGRGEAGDGLATSLRAAFQNAYRQIVDCCQSEPNTRGMGTTLTAVVIEPGEGAARVGHIGDSRLYRMRDGSLAQVTRDHTWVQREVDAGRLSSQAARTHPLSHIVTRVLSEDIDPEIDQLVLDLEPGDLLLLATDGLYNMVDDPAIESTLLSGLPLPQLTHRLIDAANAAGGADNITVVLVQILPGNSGPPTR